MLLREVLSDTHQPSFVEAADQQERCSFKRDSWQRSWTNFNIIRVIRWNKFRQIFISYHLATGEYLFSFRSDERLPSFNSLPSSHSYPGL
jgi:hypothetical protein